MHGGGPGRTGRDKNPEHCREARRRPALPGTGTARRPGRQTNELGETGAARRLPRARNELHAAQTLHFELFLRGRKTPTKCYLRLADNFEQAPLRGADGAAGGPQRRAQALCRGGFPECSRRAAGAPLRSAPCARAGEEACPHPAAAAPPLSRLPAGTGTGGAQRSGAGRGAPRPRHARGRAPAPAPAGPRGGVRPPALSRTCEPASGIAGGTRVPPLPAPLRSCAAAGAPAAASLPLSLPPCLPPSPPAARPVAEREPPAVRAEPEPGQPLPPALPPPRRPALPCPARRSPPPSRPSHELWPRSLGGVERRGHPVLFLPGGAEGFPAAPGEPPARLPLGAGRSGGVRRLRPGAERVLLRPALGGLRLHHAVRPARPPALRAAHVRALLLQRDDLLGAGGLPPRLLLPAPPRRPHVRDVHLLLGGGAERRPRGQGPAAPGSRGQEVAREDEEDFWGAHVFRGRPGLGHRLHPLRHCVHGGAVRQHPARVAGAGESQRGGAEQVHSRVSEGALRVGGSFIFPLSGPRVSRPVCPACPLSWRSVAVSAAGGDHLRALKPRPWAGGRGGMSGCWGNGTAPQLQLPPGSAGHPWPRAQGRAGDARSGRGRRRSGAFGTQLLVAVRVPPSRQVLGALIAPFKETRDHTENFRHSENQFMSYDCGKKKEINPPKECNSLVFSPLGKDKSCKYSACIRTGPSAGADAVPVTILPW